MGLSATGIKYIIKCSKKYDIKGPVLTLGNQDIYATEQDIMRWLKDEELPIKKPAVIKRSTSSTIPKINPQAKNYINAETFFEFMGIPSCQYYDIDKFDFDHPRVVHDLEKPIDKRFHNFFNLIIDSGTMEHIFDIKSVMDNIVHITNLGGYVLQFIPAQNSLNHGFYQFSPTFFYDFYTANGFEIVESHIIEQRGNIARFHKYDQKKDYTGLLFFNPPNRLANCFLVRKISEVKEIVSPTQYIYTQLAANPEKIEDDFNRTLLDKTVTSFRKIVPIKFHGLFFKPWVFLKRLTRVKDYFDIKP